MIVDFNDLPWHDAEIIQISIDRSSAGTSDTVDVVMRWPSQDEDSDDRSIVRFVDCWGLDARMNFGVIALETVRTADVLDDEDGIDAIRAMRRAPTELPDLKCFRIETNSTASVIRIYAEGFRVLD
jgi:hypothetical protein